MKIQIKVIQFHLCNTMRSNVNQINTTYTYSSNAMVHFQSVSEWDQLERISANQQHQEHRFSNEVLPQHQSLQQSRSMKVLRIVNSNTFVQCNVFTTFIITLYENIIWTKLVLILTMVSKMFRRQTAVREGMFFLAELSQSCQLTSTFWQQTVSGFRLRC